MASIVRYNPFPSLGAVDQLMERLFDDGFRPARQPSYNGVAANLYETPDAYFVELPIPGVKADDLEVTVQEDLLTVKAKRSWEAPKDAQVIWQGFGKGQWTNSFTLPGEVNSAAVEASLEDGMLRLSLPKAEHARPRTIRVNGAATATTINGAPAERIEAGSGSTAQAHA